MEDVSTGRGVINFKVNRKLLAQVCECLLPQSQQTANKQINSHSGHSPSPLYLFQKLLESFGNEEDDKFGLNSELLNTLTRGTTLVEYR